MSELLRNDNKSRVAVRSSLGRSNWQGEFGTDAFERWHFDALSDDGREALVINFYDNFALSPRYLAQQESANRNSPAGANRIPAVSFTYSVDGRVVVASVNEFGFDELSVSDDGLVCSIGSSSFRVDTIDYGSGFFLQIELLTQGKRMIIAELEWLSIESDLSTADVDDNDAVSWNIVAPRSDVSGRISLIGRRGKMRKTVHFRGTGYHDHFRSRGSFANTVGSRFWGRGHFIDSTAVFHHNETKHESCSKFILIRDGRTHVCDMSGAQNVLAGGHRVLKGREGVFLSTDDNIRLLVEPVRTFQSGFSATRSICEMTLVTDDGKPRKANGISELVTPERMNRRLFRWIEDMRIGRNGKGPIL